MFKKIREYIKDNPEGYWFKRKMYGWGWFPVKWQGWIVVAVFVLFIAWIATLLKANPTGNELGWFYTEIFLALVILILICYKTGEKPGWQWGIKKDKTKKK